MNCDQHCTVPLAARLSLIALLLSLPKSVVADETTAEPTTERPPVTYRVTGLFSPDRQDDLRRTMEELPDIKLIAIDFDTSEASFSFDPAQAFPGAMPEQIIEQFDNRLRSISRSTFGVRAVCTIPRDKLQFVEIPIVGLDCKACCLGAYEAVYRLDGVEQATASFRDGLVTAWIDPQKANRAQLEEALKSRGVTLRGS